MTREKGAGSEVEQLGIEHMPKWDAGTASGGLTCYAATLAPSD